jgi:hypothetical protein
MKARRSIPVREFFVPTAGADEARLTYLSLAFSLSPEIEGGNEMAVRLLRAAARELAFARRLQ